jgi:hypothetical protein
MSKGDKNRTVDRDSYRDTMERIKRNEERKKAKSDADWQGLAKYLEWIEEDRDED